MAYLDHAATTPLLPDVLAAMTPYLTTEAGNPSSLHASGRRARRAVEESRETVADVLGARPSEVLFTGGGTEADNLAVKGLFWARHADDPRRRRIIASAVEHHAVLDAVGWLEEHEGAKVTWVPVDASGRVDPSAVADVLGDDVALITVMWANNEVGTVQPIAEIATLARAAGIPIHTDAVQAVGALDVSFADSGVDALTVSAHKVGGPKGIGALVLRTGVVCTPLLHGGGQEREVRSGTLDPAGIVGLATALRYTAAHRPEHGARIAGLRDALVAGVQAAIPDAVRNGDPLNSLPGIAHFSIPGCEGDSLLLLLDARGVECSTGSACTAGVARPSHVLLAMGLPEPLARGSLRFSLGCTSTPADVTAVLDVVAPVVERARRAGLSGVAK